MSHQPVSVRLRDRDSLLVLRQVLARHRRHRDPRSDFRLRVAIDAVSATLEERQ